MTYSKTNGKDDKQRKKEIQCINKVTWAMTKNFEDSMKLYNEFEKPVKKLQKELDDRKS